MLPGIIILRHDLCHDTKAKPYLGGIGKAKQSLFIKVNKVILKTGKANEQVLQ
jgi:hypothetical protein